MANTRMFERKRTIQGYVVADFASVRGKRPHQGSFTVPQELWDVVGGLKPGTEYSIELVMADDGPCAMKLVSVEVAA